ncbi:hypothetical protein PYW08_004856 [Mythimna loreyi]|uniref:Uncharacterized protein n=1 Tax=Mythimna loreyi TaxID=667449 RepID=A0ACC2QHF4_9NEOP|nr:hypothetical protein PYW08_004856 [Mythimna loreyi]
MSKMFVLWFSLIILYQFRPANSWWWGGAYKFPWEEHYHFPGFFTSTMTPFVNHTETKISNTKDTPDYRIEEPHFIRFRDNYPHEMERPYRNSPPYKQSRTIWGRYWPRVEQDMGCFCNTVYRRLTVLATCAVITTRHILTTATSTTLILRSYAGKKTLEDILGGWYDTNANKYNASLYFTPSRIHIHPMYVYDYEVNVSHPIPAMYDLSVWAATYTFYGGYLYSTQVILCKRAASGWFEYTSSIPRPEDMSIVAGYMFMKSYARRPMPWYRYIIKTDKHVWPCPKSDWHWFHCIMGEYWGRYGFDSGGGMYGCYRNKGWRRDGFIGMCAFSLKLRSIQTTHYFTVVDTWPVLDFMYDSFLGLKPAVFVDDRFEDSKWSAPVPYWGEYIKHTYKWGEEKYYQTGYIPRYRR